MPQAGAGKRGSAARPARQSGHLRPRLNGLDLAVHLWRAKWLMLAIFSPLAAIGVAAAFSLPSSYTATSRLMVATGDGYAFPAGAAPADLGALVRSEAELLRSPVVAQAAVKQVTLARAYPGIALSCKPELCAQLGAEAVLQGLVAESAPDSPVIAASFAHADPVVSADLLNAVVTAYLAYRAEVYTDTRSDGFREQRERFEEDLTELDAAIRDYLFTNNLTDLAAERDTLRQLYQAASGDLLETQSRLRQAEAQLANYRRQIETIPKDQDLYVEDTRQQMLMTMRLDRNEKAARYGAHSPVVRELDNQIAQAEAYMAAGAGAGGLVRRGPNPLYQQVEAAMATLQSEVQALREQAAELKTQITSFEVRQRRLVELAPDLKELERRREVAERSIKALSEQEVDVRTRNALTLRGANTIRVLEPASPPVAGTSLKAPAFLLALLLAALAALAAGLMQALSKRGFATPGSLERTLGLPVLAVIGKR
ncbi:Wzz/FepE/Etk N-terminal domain-containing protein [Hyphomonas sp.]|uniref:GumC family protein n=1 Tax=Hyphomonas sp. TaxID=87 RepID=UPI0025C0E28D|nr:Wzz/FepE/Etk N-terminal domain-containing protein [Hyphomonas sp.]